MGVDFQWDDEGQSVMRILAEGTWNWNDFHKNMRRATFWFDAVKHPVDMVIDLRGSTKLPAGALGHIRSLGKRIHPNGRDRVIMIGVDASIAEPLGGAEGIYRDSEREIRFVASDEEAQAILALWRDEG